MQFRKTVLENGLRIITAPQPGNLAVTVLVLVEAGSKYESKENRGVSHFLEHMCFKGTAKRPKAIDISAELDGLGAQYNAFTSLEYTGYYAKAEARHLDKVLDVISDIYLNPTFDPAEIEKEKGVIIEEINMEEDDPAAKIGRVFMSLLYGDQPAGWDIAGGKDDVLRMEREDFARYRGEHYLAANTAVVVSGAFDEEKVIAAAGAAFAKIGVGVKAQKVAAVEKQDKPALRIEFKESDQAHLVLGFRTCDIFDKRRMALEVAAHILGGGMSSRLFQKLRGELGLAYYVYAGADFYTDHGYLAASAGVDKTKVKEAVQKILQEFKAVKNERVKDDELTKVKNHLTGGIILGLETSNRLASFYGSQEIIEKHILTPEELIAQIHSVTADDIMQVAKEFFTADRLNLAVLGPFKDEAQVEEILKIE